MSFKRAHVNQLAAFTYMSGSLLCTNVLEIWVKLSFRDVHLLASANPG